MSSRYVTVLLIHDFKYNIMLFYLYYMQRQNQMCLSLTTTETVIHVNKMKKLLVKIRKKKQLC